MIDNFYDCIKKVVRLQNKLTEGKIKRPDNKSPIQYEEVKDNFESNSGMLKPMRP